MAGGLSTRDLAGKFVFRFSGFSMRNNILYNLAGVGSFTIDEDGKLLGKHRSSLTPLQGADAKLNAGRYALDGEISLSEDGVTGYAKIFFKGETETSLDLNGEFYAAAAGSADRLWLVSSRDTIPPKAGADSGTPADELVSLEAIRFP
jgi:hypothetical protein